MKKKPLTITLILVSFFVSNIFAVDIVPAPGSNFGAYYTEINSGESFEQYSRTGPYADVIVKIDADRSLVFWRASSYLPHLLTGGKKYYVSRIVAVNGDNGSNLRHDKVNMFSRVKIVENTASKVVIHWRYEPVFSHSAYPVKPVNVSPEDFVDEYYTIYANGEVTRTVREGTAKIDDWNDPLNITTQTFTLTTSGITDVNTTDPSHSSPAGPVAGNSIQGPNVITPVAWWKFDEAQGNTTRESIGNYNCTIEGHKSLWKKGVSGTALKFDGYFTKIALPAGSAPSISNAITLEAWVAIAAYPWNCLPIVQQGDNEGYFLGIDAYGYSSFKVKVDGTWQECRVPINKRASGDYVDGLYKNNLLRNKWYHLAGTYTGGTMRLYVDGQQVASRSISPANIQTASESVRIGHTAVPTPGVDNIRMKVAGDYSLDGMIDEVKIYNVALSPTQVKQSYLNFNPGSTLKENPDMAVRRLPGSGSSGKFQAGYTNLMFYESYNNMWRFGDHPDVVVEFDRSPAKFIFWRGTGYIPMMVNDSNQWYSNEFNETWEKSGGKGCMEPMAEKYNYINHARIVESSPARVVVQWRYPLVDINYVYANYESETGWSDISDWYYYIYPDGRAHKVMGVWTSGDRNHEFHEGMVITGPNQHPEQVVDINNTLILADANGNSTSYNWIGSPPEPDYKRKVIHLINFNNTYDPYTIAEIRAGNAYRREMTDYSIFPSWNHWPVGQMPSDGRYASFPDRTAHSSFTHIWGFNYSASSGDRPYYERLLIEGMTDRYTNNDLAELGVLARSWQSAPAVSNVSGCSSQGYERRQGAYLFTRTTDPIQFTINGSSRSPIYNPAFVIKNWPGRTTTATINIAGGSSDDIRQGVIRDTDGTYTLIVWMLHEAAGSRTFDIDVN